jgi:hypothetical protein
MYFEAPWYDSPLKNIGFLSAGATGYVGITQSCSEIFTWADRTDVKRRISARLVQAFKVVVFLKGFITGDLL